MKNVKRNLLLVLLATLVCANSASALSIYTNGTGNQLWDTAGNWNGGVPAAGSGAVVVYMPGVDCIIDSTTTAATDNMYIGGTYAGGSDGQILMTGGSLTSANISIGYERGGLFAMSNGSVSITGATVVGELAVGGNGVLEITSGTFSTLSMTVPYLGDGLVNLYGGTIEIGFDGSSGLLMEYYAGGNGEMDVRGDGTLTWVGDHVADLNYYIDDLGHIYAGEAGKILDVSYDSGANLTTMVVIPEPTTIALLVIGGLLLRRKR